MLFNVCRQKDNMQVTNFNLTKYSIAYRYLVVLKTILKFNESWRFCHLSKYKSAVMQLHINRASSATASNSSSRKEKVPLHKWIKMWGVSTVACYKTVKRTMNKQVCMGVYIEH